MVNQKELLAGKAIYRIQDFSMQIIEGFLMPWIIAIGSKKLSPFFWLRYDRHDFTTSTHGDSITLCQGYLTHSWQLC